MSASKIEWTDHSVNVIDGCSPASPGCDHCYAAYMVGTRQRHQPCNLPGGKGPGARPCKLEWIQGMAQAVLDAGSPQRAWGPALFIKQADVCPECAGAPGPCGSCGYATATERDPLTGRAVSSSMHNGTHAGQVGKVRKGCPVLYVPGHGIRSWAEHMEGF